MYGTLAPGEKNHWVIARLDGEWVSGTVRGYTFEITWGPAQGHEGFVPDSDGAVVPVQVLRSRQLAKSWRQIDDFEGPGYARVKTQVALEGGALALAQIYVALTDV